ncbi:RHO protein GDP dissociation inhibitor containing protein [Thecamonas trahens ATCC 50062]|uniref:RHO protein GDP dissociation inhibitor containing protein n=1 Tax=Thecamonas trahens ATCC 50062 TaxID=461836 RepID=A0A0L0D9P0_THETB|nr:RHO protein GDP dissociation inhibitor containing protein [Thecamonas trahens ATCC 50062]KNC48013.1 RHO protein GDP dissociation inhibitor containing protein [Thecamonas trahens ATCC 50062]|eukprot:XP_013759028.1 RHO protein GDP dissociation inhibitor containing protein [Thecamonas trahens ATCC 50062]
MADPEQDPVVGDDVAEDDDGTGYKVGEKKDLDELMNLDQDDDALQRWKAQLLEGVAEGATDDPRVVVISEFAFMSEGRDPIVFDFSTEEGVEAMKSSPIIIKEGCDYNLRVKFRVQNDTVLGLKFITTVKRKGVKVDNQIHMIGSYAPKPEVIEFEFPTETAPSGMLARGKYKAYSKFMDDDKQVHLEWEWAFQIKKKWE